ncbi:hypothetical protein SAMD00019534_096500 [Acytostelium subglobosum LB1]|uniref:hypothetical protein n=1 Tax=Acytostelium subglobosum LB1 TaxID=1410327 RepID=UPI000644C066|nr:hypothetical protein SAMD00019534_096500 [Acytostelium subglobosum LB1]GAM26475.1 hypothetical protein SAMD00019534_096500 [Acytostelium subglobosum LB1]|eukprot:XP_012750571.1 hypothetical protein SAMD00019534_096500 [Acytostelium subglobosum LB1]
MSTLSYDTEHRSASLPSASYDKIIGDRHGGNVQSFIQYMDSEIRSMKFFKEWAPPGFGYSSLSISMNNNNNNNNKSNNKYEYMIETFLKYTPKEDHKYLPLFELCYGACILHTPFVQNVNKQQIIDPESWSLMSKHLARVPADTLVRLLVQHVEKEPPVGRKIMLSLWLLLFPFDMSMEFFEILIRWLATLESSQYLMHEVLYYASMAGHYDALVHQTFSTFIGAEISNCPLAALAVDDLCLFRQLYHGEVNATYPTILDLAIEMRAVPTLRYILSHYPNYLISNPKADPAYSCVRSRDVTIGHFLLANLPSMPPINADHAAHIQNIEPSLVVDNTEVIELMLEEGLYTHEPSKNVRLLQEAISSFSVDTFMLMQRHTCYHVELLPLLAVKLHNGLVLQSLFASRQKTKPLEVLKHLVLMNIVHIRSLAMRLNLGNVGTVEMLDYLLRSFSHSDHYADIVTSQEYQRSTFECFKGRAMTLLELFMLEDNEEFVEYLLYKDLDLMVTTKTKFYMKCLRNDQITKYHRLFRSKQEDLRTSSVLLNDLCRDTLNEMHGKQRDHTTLFMLGLHELLAKVMEEDLLKGQKSGSNKKGKKNKKNKKNNKNKSGSKNTGTTSTLTSSTKTSAAADDQVGDEGEDVEEVLEEEEEEEDEDEMLFLPQGLASKVKSISAQPTPQIIKQPKIKPFPKEERRNKECPITVVAAQPKLSIKPDPVPVHVQRRQLRQNANNISATNISATNISAKEGTFNNNIIIADCTARATVYDKTFDTIHANSTTCRTTCITTTSITAPGSAYNTNTTTNINTEYISTYSCITCCPASSCATSPICAPSTTPKGRYNDRAIASSIRTKAHNHDINYNNHNITNEDATSTTSQTELSNSKEPTSRQQQWQQQQ